MTAEEAARVAATADLESYAWWLVRDALVSQGCPDVPWVHLQIAKYVVDELAKCRARERAARVEALREAEHALRKAAEATRGIAHPEYTRATLDDVALLDGHAEIEGRDSIAARAEEEEEKG